MALSRIYRKLLLYFISSNFTIGFINIFMTVSVRVFWSLLLLFSAEFWSSSTVTLSNNQSHHSWNSQGKKEWSSLKFMWKLVSYTAFLDLFDLSFAIFISRQVIHASNLWLWLNAGRANMIVWNGTGMLQVS